MKKRKLPIPIVFKDYEYTTPELAIHKSIIERFGGIENLLDKIEAFDEENRRFLLFDYFRRLPDFKDTVKMALKEGTGLDMFNRFYDENDKPSNHYTYFCSIPQSKLEKLSEKDLESLNYNLVVMGWFFDEKLKEKKEEA